MEDEITLATGVTARTAHVRTGMIVGDPERARPIRAALARGEVSWARAMQLFGAVGIVPAQVVPGIVEAVTAPYPAHSVHGVGGLLVPQPIFTSRLSRQVARHADSEKRHRKALAERHTFTVLDPEDGTGRFTVGGHAVRIAGAHERVDSIARRLRHEGDARTLAQLRSDVALDLLLYGELFCPEVSLTSSAVGRTSALGALGEEPGFPAVASYATFAGALPPARVHVTVSLSSLLGVTEDPGTLDVERRHEWLSASVVREAAVAAGSTWKRLVTDPATGYLADLSTHSYAVTGHLRERVIARDRITRAPGRTTPARLCDTDHDIDFAAGGPTSESNVSAKDRRGHNHKTRGTWRCTREPGVDGLITWTTPTGRSYVTTPWDYRDLDPATPPDSGTATVGASAHGAGASDVDGALAHVDEIPISPDGARRITDLFGIEVDEAFVEIAAIIEAECGEDGWYADHDAWPEHDVRHRLRALPHHDARCDHEPRSDHEARCDRDARHGDVCDDRAAPGVDPLDTDLYPPIHVRRPRRRVAKATPPTPWQLRQAGPPPF